MFSHGWLRLGGWQRKWGWSFPGPSGRCGSRRGFSAKRQKDFMNISLGKQCGGRGTSGGLSRELGAHAGSRAVKFGGGTRGYWPLPLRTALSLASHWLGPPPTPVWGQRPASGGNWARLRGWTSWVSSLVPPQHGSFCLLSPPRSKARSELLRGWDPGSQFPDEATGWAKTGTRGSSGGRGRHLDLMGVGLWNGAVVGGFPASHCWRHSGPLPAAPQALKSPDGCSDQGSLGQGSTYPGSGRVRAGDVEF